MTARGGRPALFVTPRVSWNQRFRQRLAVSGPRRWAGRRRRRQSPGSDQRDRATQPVPTGPKLSRFQTALVTSDQLDWA